MRAGTEGNPLFLEERLSSLLGSAALVRDQDGWRLDRAVAGAMPEALERLVRSRVDRLGPAARDTVVAGPGARDRVLPPRTRTPVSPVEVGLPGLLTPSCALAACSPSCPSSPVLPTASATPSSRRRLTGESSRPSAAGSR